MVVLQGRGKSKEYRLAYRLFHGVRNAENGY